MTLALIIAVSFVASVALVTFASPVRVEPDTLQYLAARLEEHYAMQKRAYALESAYRDLRHALTSRACRNGRDDPTLEPLASVLREHDGKMDALGYSEFVPR